MGEKQGSSVDDRTISAQLASFGITHEVGDGNGRRHLKYDGRSIGSAHASEAVALLAMINAAIRSATGEDSPQNEGEA
jgi:hypothetical protein